MIFLYYNNPPYVKTFGKNTDVSFNCKSECLLNNAGMNYGATRADLKHKLRHKELFSGAENVNFARSVFTA